MARRGPGETNYLEFVPRRAVDHEDGDDGRLVLLRPKWTRGVMARWLQPRIQRKFFHVRLDEVGTATWQLIDGSRSVGDICEALFELFGERVEPRFERGAKFIRQLERGEMVAVDPPAAGAGA
ncbi:MAG TPA: PqqD family protein [Polyangia bacterium]|nr:PqqD family protein [Polyangia bacterium]